MLIKQIHSLKQTNNNYTPIFYNINNTDDHLAFENLLHLDTVFLYDELYSQLKELIKNRHPSRRLTDEEYNTLIEEHIGDCPIEKYGVWVYFPWSQKVVHLLGKEEFIELRTSRNKYKITPEEQALLATKRIGIIGLSVGQSVALTMAMERVCGHLRLADFDTVDLSNLNRLRTGVSNIGLKKTIIAAREIAEMDPYLDVAVYNEGVDPRNMDDFFTKDGKLDVLVEVCDGINIKILSRYKARQLQVPVIMDTNDRGMLDIERFDLEPDRQILHGLAEGLDPDKIETMTPEEKMPFILRIVGGDDLSLRMKDSMKEIGKSIGTWPQIASSVVLGGAMTTDVCRRILLGHFHGSGRYYIDFDELIADNTQK